jgi:hypothetical protein
MLGGITGFDGRAGIKLSSTARPTAVRGLQNRLTARSSNVRFAAVYCGTSPAAAEGACGARLLTALGLFLLAVSARFLASLV